MTAGHLKYSLVCFSASIYTFYMYNKQSIIVSINREVSVKLFDVKFHMSPFFPFHLIALTKVSTEAMWIQEPKLLQGNKH